MIISQVSYRTNGPLVAYAKTKAQISFAVTAKLISAFVFATRIVQFLFYLNPKFQASSSFLSLYRPVCVGPGRKPRRPVFSRLQVSQCRPSVLLFFISRFHNVDLQYQIWKWGVIFTDNVSRIMHDVYNLQSSIKIGNGCFIIAMFEYLSLMFK